MNFLGSQGKGDILLRGSQGRRQQECSHMNCILCEVPLISHPARQLPCRNFQFYAQPSHLTGHSRFNQPGLIPFIRDNRHPECKWKLSSLQPFHLILKTFFPRRPLDHRVSLAPGSDINYSASSLPSRSISTQTPLRSEFYDLSLLHRSPD